MSELSGVFVGTFCGRVVISAVTTGGSETPGVMQEVWYGADVEPGNIASIQSTTPRPQVSASLHKVTNWSSKQCLEGNIIFEKNTASYSEIFYALTRGGALARKSFPPKSKDTLRSDIVNNSFGGEMIATEIAPIRVSVSPPTVKTYCAAYTASRAGERT